MDVSGNVYTAGQFFGTADFDPGPGTYSLSPAGNNDIFVQKMDASGNFLWARTFGGTSYDGCYSVSVDASGNVYTTGVFYETADFDPGSGTYNITSTGGYDVFVQKMSASGDFLWAKAFGGESNDYGQSVSIDASGNVYTTGYFRGTVDFDPGPGTYNLTSAGNSDVFVQKLDTSGNFLWAKAIGGLSSVEAYSVRVDASGNVYTAGLFYGTADLDPGPGTYNLTSNGSADIFVQKMDASGNFLWAKAFGGTDYDGGQSVCLDASGNVYTTGFFRRTVDFDPGTGTANLSSAGDYDVFVQKMNASGDFLWAKTFGGAGDDKSLSINLDASEEYIYITGYFEGTADFDPGSETYNLTSAGGGDIFVQKMMSRDDAELPVKLISFTAEKQEAAAFLQWKTAGELHNKGFEIEHSTDARAWKPIGFQASRVEGGNSNLTLAYIHTHPNPLPGQNYYRLKQIDIDGQHEYSPVRVLTFERPFTINVYPNPVAEAVRITGLQGGETIRIADASGRVLKSQKTRDVHASLSLDGFSDGVYHLHIIPAGREAKTFKVVKGGTVK